MTDTFVTDRETGSDVPERAKTVCSELSVLENNINRAKSNFSDCRIALSRTESPVSYTER